MVTLSDEKVNAIRDLFGQILALYRTVKASREECREEDVSEVFLDALSKESRQYKAQLEELLKEESHGSQTNN